MNKKQIFTIFIIAVIGLLAIYLRVPYLHTDLWYDEACSWFTAKQDFPAGIMNNLMTLDLQHTPLYFFLLHFWMKLFGQGETAMRFLSLIFALGTIPIVYTAANKLASQKEALFATAITAVSPLLVIFSVEVRMYPIVIFLVMLSLNYLIDFEKNSDKKSLIKLVIVNILIPYTFTGGIFYNISLLICYSIYVYKYKRTNFFKYLMGAATEFALLIPYFILLSYYSAKRSLFVISHEGNLILFNVIDVVRNFFGTTLVDNIYWPSSTPYNLTFLFTVFVIVPCVYFILGFIKSSDTDNKFLKALQHIILTCFFLSIFFALLKVNVFTVRYILYLLPPIFILSVIGLFHKLTNKHCKIFLMLFIIACTLYSANYIKTFKVLKTMSLKAARIESDKLNLGVDDMIISPFGSDAPYYFRDLTSPRIFEFDFHKEARNPYNNRFYDDSQQKEMASTLKYKVIYSAVESDNLISNNFYRYFVENVNMTVPHGHFVVLALYSSDAQSLVTAEELKKSISMEYEVQQNLLDVLFKKHLCDIRAILDLDFNLVKVYTEGTYTYLLYQKR